MGRDSRSFDARGVLELRKSQFPPPGNFDVESQGLNRQGRFPMSNPIPIRTVLLFALLIAAIVLVLGVATHAHAQVNAVAADKPFVIEYYYKAKWGHADEFLTLFKKNHLPILKKEVEMGRILRVSMVQPVYHTTEDGRWDFRVTIVYKNAAIAHDSFDSGALIKQLYPDQENYKKEEQRRFEILEAHWDLPIKDVDLDTR
jgi:hypothetical protein